MESRTYEPVPVVRLGSGDSRRDVTEAEVIQSRFPFVIAVVMVLLVAGGLAMTWIAGR